MVLNMTPFMKYLNPRIIKLSSGHLSIKIEYNDNLIGNPRGPALHGGVVATLIDHCSGFCAWSGLDNTHSSIRTVDLRIDYLKPA